MAPARGWSVPTTYGYDPVSRLGSLAHDPAGTAQDNSLTYAYNPASQIVQRTQSNTGYSFTDHVNADPITV